MDIHPPSGPTHSFKDFAIHILIVTIGILIARGLEGVRESLHDRHLVADARENFHEEILQDQGQMLAELQTGRSLEQGTKQLITDLPGLATRPSELKTRVDALEPSGYFFSSNSWTSALSSGSLAHMPSSEVSRYSDFDLIVRSYTDLENRQIPERTAFVSYVDSRPSFGPQELAEVDQRLRSFAIDTQIMVHVGEQAADTFKAALAPR